jgi:hypothetical protein
MAVGGVDDDDVHAGIDQTAGAHRGILPPAHGRGDPEAPMLVLVGVGMLAALEDVLDRDESLEHAVGVHHRQLLDPVLRQDPLGIVEAGADRRGDQVLRGHGGTNRLVEIALELEIAV